MKPAEFSVFEPGPLQSLNVRVITIARSHARRLAFEERHGWLQYEWFYGVDPALQPLPFSSRLVPILTESYGWGSIGCLLSHRRVWKDFLASNQSFMVILEDDVVISRHRFLHAIRCVPSWHPFDVLLLGAHDGYSVPQLNRFSRFNLRYGVLNEPFPDSLYCMYGYVLSREGATKLLRCARLGSLPDNFPEFHRKEPFRFLSVLPDIVRPNVPLASRSSVQCVKKLRTGLLPKLVHFVRVLWWNAFRRAA